MTTMIGWRLYAEGGKLVDHGQADGDLLPASLPFWRMKGGEVLVLDQSVTTPEVPLPGDIHGIESGEPAAERAAIRAAAAPLAAAQAAAGQQEGIPLDARIARLERLLDGRGPSSQRWVTDKQNLETLEEWTRPELWNIHPNATPEEAKRMRETIAFIHDRVLQAQRGERVTPAAEHVPE